MAKLNFPDPTLTQTYVEAGITWTWNDTLKVWSSEAGEIPGGGDVSVDVGDTRPSLPSQGDLWFCTAEREDGGGRLYVYYMDEDSGQWVDVSQPGGAGGEDGGDGVDPLWEENSGKLYPKTLTNKVGIGTANPATALHISGTGVSDSRLTVNRSGSEGVVGVTGNDLLLAGSGSDGSNGGINFYTGGSSSAVIDSNSNATFAGLTTHKAGVKVTGGNINDVYTGFYNSASNDLIAVNRQFRVAQFGNADKSVGISCNPNGKMSNTENLAISLIESTYGYGSHGVQELSLFRGAYIANTNCKGSTNCFTAEFRVNQTGADNRAVGFYSKVDSGDSLNGPAYGFYAEGTAENLFQGYSTFNNGIASLGTSRFRGGVTFENSSGGAQKTTSLFWQRADASVQGSIGTGSDTGENSLFVQSNSNHPLMFGTNGSTRFTIKEDGRTHFTGDMIISSQDYDVSTRTAGVRIGNGGATTFYRGGGGTDNPVTIRRTNSSSDGSWRAIKFENHDASVGSFIKVNGDIQKITRSVTSSVPMADGAATIVKALQPKLITQGNETFSGFLYPDLAKAYSEATDSEEEGVCRERLIPLLTKALQETIAKNEELEARLSALEGA